MSKNKWLFLLLLPMAALTFFASFYVISGVNPLPGDNGGRWVVLSIIASVACVLLEVFYDHGK